MGLYDLVAQFPFDVDRASTPAVQLGLLAARFEVPTVNAYH
jgi:hypothetical protein